MRILLLSTYLPDRIQSIEKFTQVLENGLKKFGHEVRTIRPKPIMAKIKPTSTGIGKWLGYIDKFIFFPKILQKSLSWADIVHICDHSSAPYIQYLHNFPHVVTCNDMLAIRSALGEIKENPTRWTGKQLQRMILNGLNKSQRVVCISEQTKSDLMRISCLNPDRVSRIYMGLNYPYAPMRESIREKKLKELNLDLDTQFLLHVGSNVWYKNRFGVISIFKNLIRYDNAKKLFLVMVGRSLTTEIKEFMITHNLNYKVRELIDIENESLRALYSSATALLFPSLQEGFGWPLIEAQACGCPVFTSERPPMTEICGTTGIYLDPENHKKAAEIISKSLSILDRLKSKSLENANKFTEEAMITAYIQIYQEVLSQKQK
ncbi:MAG: glycosyltransferase family 4 protein [Cyanobacteria bacterium SBLK]|nr:glycosyltransferase family 4 protein [Cyanobacteria bacterium SBLK]